MYKKIKNGPKLQDFRISGQKINTLNKAKYLGVYLDEHLTWSFQLRQIKTKIHQDRTS